MTGETSTFLDSNVWLYALSEENEQRSVIARKLVKDLGGGIFFSVQVVNEVCVNLRRKFQIEEEQVRTLIDSFYMNYHAVDLTGSVLTEASKIREAYSFSFWDSLIAATARSVNATVLFSEDLQDGFVLDNQLRIINPFN